MNFHSIPLKQLFKKYTNQPLRSILSSMSRKILLYLGLLVLYVFGFNSFVSLPPIHHCREIVTRNYMPDRIPSVLMEISCEIGHEFNACGRFSKVSFCPSD